MKIASCTCVRTGAHVLNAIKITLSRGPQGLEAFSTQNSASYTGSVKKCLRFFKSQVFSPSGSLFLETQNREQAALVAHP